ncbi:MAG: hypothetical protein FWG72_00285 [Oscillospiraceae bacterium]|nr:hypothetical protein [Oscillospiraceae bacterium]
MAQWYEGQLRILQTVLRETDIIGYDARAVVGYMKETRSNVLVVNAGGIVDFFRNELEPAHWNPFMREGQEILSDLCEQIRSEGLRMIARVDFRGVQKYRYEARPDWFAQQADGSPKLNPQGLCAPCYMSRYANEHAVEFIRRLMVRFPLDGIWENSVAFGAGMCYCPRCLESYRKEAGVDIPAEGEASPAALSQYRAWRKTRADGHIRRLRAAVKEFGEDKAYVAEVFGMYHASASLHSGIDTYTAEHFDFIVGVGFLTGAPHGRPYDDLSYASSAARFLKAIDPVKTTVLLTGNNGTKWRLVKDPSLETRIWMWEAVSVGANLWNCLFNGMHPGAAEDRRNAYIESDAYRYLEAHQDVIQAQTPVREAAILFSKPTRDLFGRDHEAQDRYGVGIRGLERVLNGAHIPYGFITERDLSPEALKDVKVLCLPNCACLSDGQAEVIRAFVRNGGGLMASLETSLYDEDGLKRPDFALSDVLGVSVTGMVKDTSQDCYQMIRAKDHPLLRDMGAERTRFLISGGETVLAAPNGKGVSVATYIPLIPNQYPEQAWIRDEYTRFPTVYCHPYGKGQAVYFAANTEALVYLNGHEDFWNLVGNALRYLRGGPWMLETDAPDTTHIHLLQDRGRPGSFLLSCVNHLTGASRAARSLHPARPCAVTLRLPGASSARVKTLYAQAGNEVSVTRQSAGDGVLTLELSVPGFDEFISAHIVTT